MKDKIKQEQIEANLELLYQNLLVSEKIDFNVFVINTPKGQMRIKSELSLEEFKNQWKNQFKKINNEK